jgi:hypothetical protein
MAQNGTKITQKILKNASKNASKCLKMPQNKREMTKKKWKKKAHGRRFKRKNLSFERVKLIVQRLLLKTELNHGFAKVPAARHFFLLWKKLKNGEKMEKKEANLTENERKCAKNERKMKGIERNWAKNERNWKELSEIERIWAKIKFLHGVKMIKRFKKWRKAANLT